MFRGNKQSLLRSPLFITGGLTAALAAIGIVLSVATIVSFHFSGPRILPQLRQLFAPSLRAEQIPEDRIQNFLAGQVLSSNELSRLPEPQAQALLSAQEGSIGLLSSTQQALTIARQRCLFGTGLCIIIFFLGLGLAAKAINKVRTTQAERS